MPVLLLLAFIVVPIVELYVILQVGQEIGVLWTIVLLIADSVLGSLLMRSQGRAAWRRFNDALAQRRVPAREVLDGMLIIFAGALLLTPGFVTDLVGLSLLAPPTRAIVRGLLVSRFAGPMVAAGMAARRRGRGRERPVDEDSADVEGSATEVDPRALP